MALPTFKDGEILTGANLTSGFSQEQQDTLSKVASTYLTQTNAASTYLAQTNAASTYLTQANAASTYLTQANAASTYATLPGAVTNIFSIANLRNTNPVTSYVARVQSYYGDGNGGGGDFYAVTGAASGTYVDDGGYIIVPTGGDGSSAWIRLLDYVDASMFGFGETQSGSVNFSAVEAAVKAAATIGIACVYLPDGNYSWTGSMAWPSTISLRSVGTTQLNSNGQSGEYLNFVWYTDSVASSISTTIPQDFSFAYIAELKNIVFNDGTNTSDGIIFGNTSSTSSTQVIGMKIIDCSFKGLNHAAQLQNNAWLFSFHGCCFNSNNYDWGAVNDAQPTNAGEKISFYDCLFSSTKIRSLGPYAWATFTGGSFDYPASGAYIYDSTVPIRYRFYKVHFEGSQTNGVFNFTGTTANNWAFYIDGCTITFSNDIFTTSLRSFYNQNPSINIYLTRTLSGYGQDLYPVSYRKYISSFTGAASGNLLLGEANSTLNCTLRYSIVGPNVDIRGKVDCATNNYSTDAGISSHIHAFNGNGSVTISVYNDTSTGSLYIIGAFSGLTSTDSYSLQVESYTRDTMPQGALNPSLTGYTQLTTIAY